MRTIAATTATLFIVTASLVYAQGQSGDELARRQALERYRAGQELLVAERYEQAAEEFTAAVDLDPLLALAHYGLGQSYMGLKRYASAIQAFTGAKDAYGRIVLLRQNDRLAAERRLDDEARELRDSLARVRSGQIKGASPSLEQQLENRLDEVENLRRGRNAGVMQVPAEVSLALGSAYYRNNQPQDAERQWLAAVGVNPRLGEAHNNLAVLYLVTGRKQQAQDAVKAAERARFRVHPQLKADIGRMKQ